jgi:hypothetical protein
MRYIGWSEPAPNGGLYHTISRHKPQSLCRFIVGSTSAIPKPSFTIPHVIAKKRPSGSRSLPRLFWTIGLSARPPRGTREGYDSTNEMKGSQIHLTVDTAGHLLALLVTAADEQDRSLVPELSAPV